MNFLMRAVLSVWGHKAKTIILFVAFAVIGSMLLSSLAIENTSKQVINQAKEDIGCKITVIPKTIAGQNFSVPVYPRIDRQYESELRNTSHLTLVNRIQEFSFYAKSFELPLAEKEDNPKSDTFCTVQAITDTSKFSAFSSGAYKLVAGRHLTKADTGKNYVIINEKTAEYNNIKVDDTITAIAVPEDKILQTKEIDCKFIVKGIYKLSSQAEFDYMSDSFTKTIYASDCPNFYLGFNPKTSRESLNRYIEQLKKEISDYKLADENNDSGKFDPDKMLYESDKVILEQIEKIPNYYPITEEDIKEPTMLEITVDSPENLDYVLNSLNKININDRYEFQLNNEQYNRIIAPIKTSKGLASLFTYVIFATGLILMVLIVVLSLRNRKHEFGILLAMGEKKIKIILQVLTETLIPVAVSFIIAFSASGFIANITAQKIVNENYKPFNTSMATMDQINEMKLREPDPFIFNANGIEQIHNINVSLTPQDIGIFAGCSLFIVLLACGIPMIKIMKLSPMNVLTHKN